MSFKIFPRAGIQISGATAVEISHINDSITLGDGTNLIGTFANIGGVRSLPVDIKATVGATDAVLIGGTQRTKLTDGVDNVEVDDVGGEKALKVSVISTVAGGGGGTAATDNAAFTASASQLTPIGGQYDSNESDTVADGKMAMVGITSVRHMKVDDIRGNALLTTQAGYLDGIETSLTTLIGHVDGLEGFTDGIEALIGTTNTNTGGSATSLALIDDIIFADDAGFTAATSKVAVVGGQYQSSPNTLDDGDAGSILLDTNHAVQTVIRAGSAVIGAVTQSGTWNIGSITTLPSLVAGNANIGDVDVASIAAGDNNIGNVDVLSVIAAASTNKVDIGLINAVTPLMGSGVMGTGSLRVTIASNNDPLDVKQGTAANLKAEVVGSAAHDNGSPGVPVMIAARAKNASPTSVADGDVTYINADLAGRVVTQPLAPRELVTRQNATVSNTTETTIVTAVASTFLDLCFLMLTNTSATAVRADIRDTTGGTVLFSVGLAANGGAVIPFPTPIPQTTVNTNWTIQMSGSVTDIRILALAVKRV